MANELDFTSSSFNPLKALYKDSLQPPVPNVPIFNTINEYANSLKLGKPIPKRGKHVLACVKPQANGGNGEGSLAQRLKNIADNKVRSRNRDPSHLAHLMKVKSKTDGIEEKVAMLDKTKKRHRQKNVLERMEGQYKEGPLSILYNCIEKKKQLRVWTRRLKGVRGICVGYLVAYDKHLNLAMMDVDEMFSIEEDVEVDPMTLARRVEKKKEKKRNWRRKKRCLNNKETTNNKSMKEGEMLDIVLQSRIDETRDQHSICSAEQEFEFNLMTTIPKNTRNITMKHEFDNDACGLDTMKDKHEDKNNDEESSKRFYTGNLCKDETNSTDNCVLTDDRMEPTLDDPQLDDPQLTRERLGMVLDKEELEGISDDSQDRRELQESARKVDCDSSNQKNVARLNHGSYCPSSNDEEESDHENSGSTDEEWMLKMWEGFNTGETQDIQMEEGKEWTVCDHGSSSATDDEEVLLRIWQGLCGDTEGKVIEHDIQMKENVNIDLRQGQTLYDDESRGSNNCSSDDDGGLRVRQDGLGCGEMMMDDTQMKEKENLTDLRQGRLLDHKNRGSDNSSDDEEERLKIWKEDLCGDEMIMHDFQMKGDVDLRQRHALCNIESNSSNDEEERLKIWQEGHCDDDGGMATQDIQMGEVAKDMLIQEGTLCSDESSGVNSSGGDDDEEVMLQIWRGLSGGEVTTRSIQVKEDELEQGTVSDYNISSDGEGGESLDARDLRDVEVTAQGVQIEEQERENKLKQEGSPSDIERSSDDDDEDNHGDDDDDGKVMLRIWQCDFDNQVEVTTYDIQIEEVKEDGLKQEETSSDIEQSRNIDDEKVMLRIWQGDFDNQVEVTTQDIQLNEVKEDENKDNRYEYDQNIKCGKLVGGEQVEMKYLNNVDIQQEGSPKEPLEGSPLDSREGKTVDSPKGDLGLNEEPFQTYVPLSRESNDEKIGDNNNEDTLAAAETSRSSLSNPRRDYDVAESEEKPLQGLKGTFFGKGIKVIKISDNLKKVQHSKTEGLESSYDTESYQKETIEQQIESDMGVDNGLIGSTCYNNTVSIAPVQGSKTDSLESSHEAESHEKETIEQQIEREMGVDHGGRAGTTFYNNTVSSSPEVKCHVDIQRTELESGFGGQSIYITSGIDDSIGNTDMFGETGVTSCTEPVELEVMVKPINANTLKTEEQKKEACSRSCNEETKTCEEEEVGNEDFNNDASSKLKIQRSEAEVEDTQAVTTGLVGEDAIKYSETSEVRDENEVVFSSSGVAGIRVSFCKEEGIMNREEITTQCIKGKTFDKHGGSSEVKIGKENDENVKLFKTERQTEAPISKCDRSSSLIEVQQTQLTSNELVGPKDMKPFETNKDENVIEKEEGELTSSDDEARVRCWEERQIMSSEEVVGSKDVSKVELPQHKRDSETYSEEKKEEINKEKGRKNKRETSQRLKKNPGRGVVGTKREAVRHEKSSRRVDEDTREERHGRQNSSSRVRSEREKEGGGDRNVRENDGKGERKRDGDISRSKTGENIARSHGPTGRGSSTKIKEKTKPLPLNGVRSDHQSAEETCQGPPLKGFSENSKSKRQSRSSELGTRFREKSTTKEKRSTCNSSSSTSKRDKADDRSRRDLPKKSSRTESGAKMADEVRQRECCGKKERELHRRGTSDGKNDGKDKEMELLVKTTSSLDKVEKVEKNGVNTITTEEKKSELAIAKKDVEMESPKGAIGARTEEELTSKKQKERNSTSSKDRPSAANTRPRDNIKNISAEKTKKSTDEKKEVSEQKKKNNKDTTSVMGKQNTTKQTRDSGTKHISKEKSKIRISTDEKKKANEKNKEEIEQEKKSIKKQFPTEKSSTRKPTDEKKEANEKNKEDIEREKKSMKGKNSRDTVIKKQLPTEDFSVLDLSTRKPTDEKKEANEKNKEEIEREKKSMKGKNSRDTVIKKQLPTEKSSTRKPTDEKKEANKKNKEREKKSMKGKLYTGKSSRYTNIKKQLPTERSSIRKSTDEKKETNEKNKEEIEREKKSMKGKEYIGKNSREFDIKKQLPTEKSTIRKSTDGKKETNKKNEGKEKKSMKNEEYTRKSSRNSNDTTQLFSQTSKIRKPTDDKKEAANEKNKEEKENEKKSLKEKERDSSKHARDNSKRTPSEKSNIRKPTDERKKENERNRKESTAMDKKENKVVSEKRHDTKDKGVRNPVRKTKHSEKPPTVVGYSEVKISDKSLKEVRDLEVKISEKPPTVVGDSEVKISGKRRRQDSDASSRPSKVRKGIEKDQKNIKRKEAKLPGKVATVRVLKVERDKALVLKRRHVNQLFVRGDNVIMVAYENTNSVENKV